MQKVSFVKVLYHLLIGARRALTYKGLPKQMICQYFCGGNYRDYNSFSFVCLYMCTCVHVGAEIMSCLNGKLIITHAHVA